MSSVLLNTELELVSSKKNRFSYTKKDPNVRRSYVSVLTRNISLENKFDLNIYFELSYTQLQQTKLIGFYCAGNSLTSNYTAYKRRSKYIPPEWSRTQPFIRHQLTANQSTLAVHHLEPSISSRKSRIVVCSAYVNKYAGQGKLVCFSS